MARLLTASTNNFLNCLTGTAVPYPFSVSCRLKLLPTTSGVPFTYGEGSPSWDGEYSGATAGAAGAFTANTGKGSQFSGASYSMSVTAGQWYLVIFVFDGDDNFGSSRRVYVDNASQTAVDEIDVLGVGHLNKNFTLGGVLVPGMHFPAAYDGEIADVAFWNTALTAGDVNELVTKRPGQVKAANLLAWWKLGADGDLSSSVGTYGPMVATGTVPITADPPYTPPIIVKRLYVPDHFRDDEELDLNHPLLKACTGYFPLHPDKPFWNPLRPDVPMFRNNWGYSTTTPARSGELNSTRFSGQKLSVDANKMPMDVGYPWSCTLGAWVKPHGFWSPSGHNMVIGGDNNHYYEPFPGGGPRLGIIGDGSVSLSGHESFEKRIGTAAGLAPLNQWTHIVGCFESIYHGYRYPNAYIWVNGKLVVSSISNAGLGIDQTTNKWTVSIGSVTWYPEFPTKEGIFYGDIRDAFYYGRKLSDDEVRWLYEQTPDLYIKRTPRLYFFATPTQNIGKATALSITKGVSLSPGTLLRMIGAARAPAFSRGITHTPGTALKSIAKALAPAQGKGVRPQGGLISQALSKVMGAAQAKGIYFLPPPFLTSWAKAIAPAFSKGITGTGGPALGNIAKAPAPAKGKGILPQGGIIAQAISLVMGFARVSGVMAYVRDFSFHGSLTRMNSTQPWASIERERRTLLGADSKLELLSISGHEWILEQTLETHWVARRARFLGTSDEWLLEIPEATVGGFSSVRDLAGARIYTHGQTLTFRINQVNRPLKAGHVWEFQLEAIGDAT